MSKHLLSFLLSELKTVRILCQNKACGAVSEMPLSEVERLLFNSQCRFCGTSFRVGNEDSLALLAQTVKNLQSITSKVQVEFVLEAKD